MRYRSKARAAIEREVMPDRKAFIAEILSCAACGSEWRRSYPAALDCHEIIRGGARVSMIRDRRSWLVVCRTHHDEMGDYSKWSVVLQFGLKMRQDPEWYDLEWLNAQRGAGVGCSQDEVDDALTKYDDERYGS